MVVVIVVVAGIHTLRSRRWRAFIMFSNGKTQSRNPEPRTQNSKPNPEHIMTLVMVQFPDNATKIDEGYLAHEPWYFRP